MSNRAKRNRSIGQALVLLITGGIVGAIVALFAFNGSSLAGVLTGAVAGAGVGLIVWALVTIVRIISSQRGGESVAQTTPQFDVTRGGFKETRLSTGKMVPSTQKPKEDVPVRRMPVQQGTDIQNRQRAIVLIAVVLIGIIAGTFFGWAELVDVFGQFNLIIYGTVTLVLILVVIIAVLESKA
ncbi:MAG TPA: hypothetical protein VI522_00675 [Gammaproteobacteria bacterium]|nr:hypothetical protein [Gammaproteobacteria bacterium]